MKNFFSENLELIIYYAFVAAFISSATFILAYLPDSGVLRIIFSYINAVGYYIVAFLFGFMVFSKCKKFKVLSSMLVGFFIFLLISPLHSSYMYLLGVVDAMPPVLILVQQFPLGALISGLTSLAGGLIFFLQSKIAHSKP